MRTIFLEEEGFGCTFLCLFALNRKEMIMPIDMTQTSYTSDNWASQIQNPQNRAEPLQAVLDQWRKQPQDHVASRRANSTLAASLHALWSVAEQPHP